MWVREKQKKEQKVVQEDERQERVKKITEPTRKKGSFFDQFKMWLNDSMEEDELS